MTMRLWLSSAALCGLLSAPALVSHAWAQGAVSYQPSSGWAVSRVDGRDKGASPYCALARRFTGDLILTLARNTTGESSLAIDFQRPSFAKGKNYAVALSAGDDMSRAFEVTPVSTNAFVIRTGRDEGFYDALEQSGQMGINVAGKVYALQIPDLGNGRSQLGACVGSLIEPAAGEAIQTEKILATPDKPLPKPGSKPPETAVVRGPDGSTAVVAQEREERVSTGPDLQVTALERDIDALRAENQRLANALERERREFENRFQQQSADSSMISEVREKLALLETENGALKEKLAAAGNGAQAKTEASEQDKGRISALESQLSALQVEKEKIQGDLAAARQSAQGSEAAAARLAALEEDNRKLNDQLSHASAVQPAASDALTDQISSLGQELAGLRAENASLAQQLQAAQTAAAKADGGTAALASLTSRVEELQKENAHLTDELAAARSAASAAPSVAAAAAPADSPEQDVSAWNRARVLETELNSVKAQKASLAAELDKLRREREQGRLTLASDNWNLEQATRRYNEAEREIQRLGALLEDERARCASDKTKLEGMLFDPAVAGKEQIARLMSLEGRLKTAEAQVSGQNKEADARMASLQQDLKAKQDALEQQKAQMAGMDQKMRELQATMETAHKERDAAASRTQVLAAELQAAKNGAESESKEVIARLQAEKDSPAKAMESARKAAEATETEQSDIARQIDGLRSEMAARDKAYQNTIANLQTERDGLQVALSQTQVQRDAAGQQKLALAAELEKQKAGAASETQAAITALQTEKETLQTALARAQLEVQQAKAQSAAASRSTDGAVQEVAVLRDELSGQIAALRSQNEELQSALAEVRTEAGTVRQAAADSVASRPVSADAPVSAPAPVVQALALPAAAAQSYGENTAIAPRVRFSTPAEIQNMLGRAGVTVIGSVQPIDSVSGPDFAAFRWDTGQVYGSAEQRPLAGSQGFQSMVQDYIAKTRSRCSGDFAAAPGYQGTGAYGDIASYEIACVVGGQGSSAALIFFSRDGVFTSVAHEANMESMDTAMNSRDGLLSSLTETKTALR